jgi:thiamine biosynthesis lipoprotein ApbE
MIPAAPCRGSTPMLPTVPWRLMIRPSECFGWPMYCTRRRTGFLIRPSLRSCNGLDFCRGRVASVNLERHLLGTSNCFLENAFDFRRAGLRLDLGGIAKGFAVDEAVNILRRGGIKCGLVNAGGDLRAFGPRPFAVGIRDPRRPGTMFASLVLKNCALATSAHYFAARLRPGARLGPFVDPRSGEFRSELASVTVVAKSALTADALTKVVMLDPDNSLAILQRFAAESLVWTAQGTVFSTLYWQERLQAAA